ncbi:MAG: methyltransferase domain-containing protein [Pirellulales bacterium]|nr:methyltransferase domain-containing protein [Pirellulales bacterium]
MDTPEPFAQSDPRIAFFDRLAATCDVAQPTPTEILRCIEQSADLLQLKPGESVLEVGCGTGPLTGWLAARVRPGRVVAIDFSPAMLDKAKAKCPDAEFRLADACRGPLDESRYDLAFCFRSFPHFRDQAAAVKNLAHALKPGARLVVLHFAGSQEINDLHRKLNDVVSGDYLPPPNEWENLLLAAELRLVELVDRRGLFYLRAVREPPTA